MNFGAWQWLKRLPGTLAAPRLEPAEQAQRIIKLQRNIILPARLLVIGFVLYHLHVSPWNSNVVTDYGVLFETMLRVFDSYALLALVVTTLFYVARRFPPGSVQWLVFIMGLGDGVFLGGLTVLTGGFESILYWVYPAIIILNAISIPLATPQIVLNLMLGVLFLLAGLLELSVPLELRLEGEGTPRRISRMGKLSAEDFTNDLQRVCVWLQQTPEVLRTNWLALSEPTRAAITNYLATGGGAEELKPELARELNGFATRPARRPIDVGGHPELPEISAGPYVLRVAVLVLFTFCCYGLQVLVAAQQKAEEEQKEFLVRTEQLRGAGRLAAEFAHQIKNPLAIINNAVFSLQRALKHGRPESEQHLQIIQEEVARADQTITQIMGYAQLSEGRVEKLAVLEELERAIEQVFPRAIATGIQVHRDFAPEFPPLLMQRRHLSECVVNLLQNAREALGEQGNIFVTATCGKNYAVEITIRDDGPGIAPDKVERIFEAYYTTKDRGTGLGLAIVKHNIELYAGSVRVESALGQGARFILVFPAKTLIKLGK